MEYNELVQKFTEQFGISGVQIEDGSFALDIDGILVEFLYRPDTNTLILVAEIGEPPTDSQGRFREIMLKANYLFDNTNGMTLGQNPANNKLVLQKIFHILDLDVDSFSNAIEKLVNQVEEWKSIVEGYNDVESEAQEFEKEEKKIQSLSSQDSFMRV